MPIVYLRSQIFVVTLVLLAMPAEAQRQSRPSDMVRERAVVARDVLDPYWSGFIAKARGNCDLAVEELAAFAAQGRGFEDAQTALGLCEMMRAGYKPDASDRNQSQILSTRDGFVRGRELVNRAADAGFHGAQAEMARLYMFNVGPEKDPAEGAKWAHLYLTNPVRLSIGLENNIEDVVARLQENVSSQAWLEGKERARYWYPVFEFIRDAEPAGGQPPMPRPRQQKGKTNGKLSGKSS
jgi:hypothetical protein